MARWVAGGPRCWTGTPTIQAGAGCSSCPTSCSEGASSGSLAPGCSRPSTPSATPRAGKCWRCMPRSRARVRWICGGCGLVSSICSSCGRRTLRALAVAGVVASMQPIHATRDAPWVAARVGELRRCAVPTRGDRCCARARCWPSAPISPWRARIPGSGCRRPRPAGPMARTGRGNPKSGSRATRPSAASRRARRGRAFAEDRRGTLREGAEADLTLFGGDLMDVPVDELAGVPVMATIVGGRIEHQAAHAG